MNILNKTLYLDDQLITQLLLTFGKLSLSITFIGASVEEEEEEGVTFIRSCATSRS